MKTITDKPCRVWTVSLFLTFVTQQQHKKEKLDTRLNIQCLHIDFKPPFNHGTALLRHLWNAL